MSELSQHKHPLTAYDFTFPYSPSLFIYLIMYNVDNHVSQACSEKYQYIYRINNRNNTNTKDWIYEELIIHFFY